MKLLALTFVLATLLGSVTAFADDWLENGDFIDGTTHWRGNGRTAADFASDNPFDKPDPFLAKGLILPLRGVWDKIQQDFRGRGTHGILTIVYKLSPDISFSTKPEDYKNIPDQLHYGGWAPFPLPIGSWVVFIADLGSARGTYWHIEPKLGSSEPQVVRMKVSGLTALEDKTITLGFPPGTGKIVLLGISLSDESAPASGVPSGL